MPDSDQDAPNTPEPEDLAPTKAVPGHTRSRSLADPTQVGPYRILQKIADGGMGSVFVAEQREPVQRKVAIKLIEIGMDTKECSRAVAVVT